MIKFIENIIFHRKKINLKERIIPFLLFIVFFKIITADIIAPTISNINESYINNHFFFEINEK